MSNHCLVKLILFRQVIQRINNRETIKLVINLHRIITSQLSKIKFIHTNKSSRLIEQGKRILHQFRNLLKTITNLRSVQILILIRALTEVTINQYKCLYNHLIL